MSWTLVSIIMAIFVTVMNLIGTKTAAVFQKVLTIAIAGVGILLIVGALFSGNVHNLENQLFWVQIKLMQLKELLKYQF